MTKKIEVDIDEQENISMITNVIYGDDKFYLMCNKKGGKLGYFLFSLDLNNPEENGEYYIRWSNKLDIADCDMALMMDKRTR
jgi:hypothetical protein